jgi:DNA-binding XRE family transcriptional regulator
VRDVNEYYINVGSRLRYARSAIGMTREELAKLFEVNPQTVYNIEKGKVKLSLDKARVAAEAMGCTVDWLCGATNHLKLNGYFKGKWFNMEADLEPFGLGTEPSL